MRSYAAIRPEAVRLLEAADGLAETIGTMRDEVERDRRLPASLVNNLQAAGLFRLWLARRFGGPELNLIEFASVIERLAQADGSVAWCVSVGAALSRFSGFLPEVAARRIFLEDNAVVAGALAPDGRAIAVDGGYRVSGRWAYGSGIMHSNWTVGASIIFADGQPRRTPSGAMETQVMFFPTSAVEIIDTWEVGGLRGTGSHDYRVSDIFVPDDYAVPGIEPLLPGPLYALSRHSAYPVAIASVPLGIARAALDTFKTLSGNRTPQIGTTLLRDKLTIQFAIGRAEASLRAARAFLFEVCDDAWTTVSSGRSLGLEQRALVRLACAHAATTSKEVVQVVYDAGGGASVYEVGLLQRHLRDVQVAAQHFQAHSANFESGGRVMLGMDPETVHI
jgi:indole-3-acetate monooxygenase